MPVNIIQPERSPTGSWLATATQSRGASPTQNATSQMNGTRVASPVQDTRPARQDKKRMSLAFFGIGSDGTLQKSSEKEQKHEKPIAEDLLETASVSAESRDQSKDRTKATNRLSSSFMGPSSPVPEALPTFPGHSSSQHSLGRIHSRDRSMDSRPQTGKSGKSEKSEQHNNKRTSSVKKRFSAFSLGKKSSKANVRGRVDDTLEEE